MATHSRRTACNWMASAKMCNSSDWAGPKKWRERRWIGECSRSAERKNQLSASPGLSGWQNYGIQLQFSGALLLWLMRTNRSDPWRGHAELWRFQLNIRYLSSAKTWKSEHTMRKRRKKRADCMHEQMRARWARADGSRWHNESSFAPANLVDIVIAQHAHKLQSRGRITFPRPVVPTPCTRSTVFSSPMCCCCTTSHRIGGSTQMPLTFPLMVVEAYAVNGDEWKCQAVA